MFNVLKKTLCKEFGQARYEQYACFIKRSIRESGTDNSEIYNDLYKLLKAKDETYLAEMQQRLDGSLLEAFYVNKNYLWAFVEYLVAFVVIASFVIQKYAFFLLLIISAAFLVKTYEFLVNKFCYVDVHLVLIYRAVLDRVRAEKRKNGSEAV